jgi:hypothetical protein
LTDFVGPPLDLTDQDMAGCFMNKLVHEFGGFSAANV